MNQPVQGQLLPTRDSVVTHYGASLVCVSVEQDEEDDTFVRVTLVQHDGVSDEVVNVFDLTDENISAHRSRLVFSGPATATGQYKPGSRHFMSSDIETFQ